MDGKKDSQYFPLWFRCDQIPDGLFYGDMDQKIDGDDDSDDQPYQSDKRAKAIATTPKCYQFHQNSYIYF